MRLVLPEEHCMASAPAFDAKGAVRPSKFIGEVVLGICNRIAAGRTLDAGGAHRLATIRGARESLEIGEVASVSAMIPKMRHASVAKSGLARRRIKISDDTGSITAVLYAGGQPTYRPPLGSCATAFEVSE